MEDIAEYIRRAADLIPHAFWGLVVTGTGIAMLAAARDTSHTLKMLKDCVVMTPSEAVEKAPLPIAVVVGQVSSNQDISLSSLPGISQADTATVQGLKAVATASRVVKSILTDKTSIFGPTLSREVLVDQSTQVPFSISDGSATIGPFSELMHPPLRTIISSFESNAGENETMERAVSALMVGTRLVVIGKLSKNQDSVTMSAVDFGPLSGRLFISDSNEISLIDGLTEMCREQWKLGKIVFTLGMIVLAASVLAWYHSRKDIWASQKKKRAILEKLNSEEDAEKARSSMQEGNSLPTCVVCMTNHRETVLVPCGHQALCVSCAKTVALKPEPAKCPVCRSQITQIFRVFSP